MFRKSAVELLLGVLTLQHLACAQPGSLFSLESRGEVWGEQGEGKTQGDPETGMKFNVSIQPDAVELDRKLGPRGGVARFGQDDGYAIGRPGDVHPAFQDFVTAMRACCGL